MSIKNKGDFMRKIFIVLLNVFFISTVFIHPISMIDLSFAILNKAEKNKGNIFIRNVTDNRVEGKEQEDLNFIGFLRSDMGIPFPYYSTQGIDKVMRELVSNCLEFSGYNVVQNNDTDCKVLDVSIDNFYMDGYLVYGIACALTLKLYSKDGKLLYENKISTSTAFTTFGKMSQAGIQEEMTNSYNRLLTKTVKNISTLLNDISFNESYNGKVRTADAEINMPKKKLTSIPANIDNAGKITMLNLYSNNIEKIQNLDNFTSLNELDLAMNKIGKIENLNNLKNLRILNLSNNKISSIKNLDDLTSLDDLDLNNNSINKIENLKNMQWLVLSYNDISVIENLDRCPGLKWLNLAHTKIKGIKNIDSLQNLIWLNLNSTDISKIENLDKLKNLLSLDLSSSNISKIENLDGLTNLLYLNLSYNTFTKKIEGLDKLVNLKKLNIADCLYKKIEGLENLVNLEDLNISRNPINKIENMDNLKNLKIFNFSNTFISKIENIEKFEKIEQLIFIPIRINSISKASYDFLKNKNWVFEGLPTISKKPLPLDDFIKKYGIKIVE
jgi:Leucine-rich repeat (LRR) protein